MSTKTMSCILRSSKTSHHGELLRNSKPGRSRAHWSWPEPRDRSTVTKTKSTLRLYTCCCCSKLSRNISSFILIFQIKFKIEMLQVLILFQVTQVKEFLSFHVGIFIMLLLNLLLSRLLELRKTSHILLLRSRLGYYCRCY